MPEETVTISVKEYKELMDAAKKLAVLEVWGVDNWEWYDEALVEYRAEKEEEE